MVVMLSVYHITHHTPPHWTHRARDTVSLRQSETRRRTSLHGTRPSNLRGLNPVDDDINKQVLVLSEL